MKHKKLLESICNEECKGQYCFLQEYILQSGIEDRIVEQIACIHKLKYIQSVVEKKDIGWNRAFELWVDMGYAERFAKVYDPNKTHQQIYREVINCE